MPDVSDSRAEWRQDVARQLREMGAEIEAQGLENLTWRMVGELMAVAAFELEQIDSERRGAASSCGTEGDDEWQA